MGQLKGQLTRHVRVSGQNASCTVVLHFAELTVAFFSFSLFNENVQPQPISSFFFKFFLRLQTELDSARSYLVADDQWRNKFYCCVDWICHMLLYV